MIHRNRSMIRQRRGQQWLKPSWKTMTPPCNQNRCCWSRTASRTTQRSWGQRRTCCNCCCYPQSCPIGSCTVQHVSDTWNARIIGCTYVLQAAGEGGGVGGGSLSGGHRQGGGGRSSGGRGEGLRLDNGVVGDNGGGERVMDSLSLKRSNVNVVVQNAQNHVCLRYQ